MLDILEFPSNLGLNASKPNAEPGVKKLPAWLKKYGFYDLLQPQQILTIHPPAYSTHLDKESGVRNADNIASYALQQADLLGKTVRGKGFSVVIGGDCSILIGNTLALKQLGNYGLFFLDGHTDFAWPSMSQSKGAAGMDLAIVTGNAHDKLSNINNLKPYINEEHVWCVANRDYDDLYVETIENSNINYFDLDKLRQMGFANCCNLFLEMIKERNLDGFWIHLDVDVLNDEIMPAVDSRELGGLNYNELEVILGMLLESDKAIGIEITILDPDLDPEGIYTKPFISVIGSIIKAKKN